MRKYQAQEIRVSTFYFNDFIEKERREHLVRKNARR